LVVRYAKHYNTERINTGCSYTTADGITGQLLKIQVFAFGKETQTTNFINT